MSAYQTAAYWLVFALLTLGYGVIFPGKDSQRDSSVKPITLVLLSLAILLGAYLRLQNLDFGFPETYHPDEVRKARILRTMSENATWNPKYFLHPSLLLYLSKIVSRFFYAIDIYPELNILRNILAGRFVSAIAGVGTVAVSYLIAREFFKSTLFAAVTALLVATCPLALDCSRYYKEDSLFCFFLLVSFYFSLLSVKERRFSNIAGFFAGVCAGSKYTGFVSLFFPIAVLFLPALLRQESLPWIRNVKSAVLILLAAVIGFVLTTPYAVLTPSSVWSGITYESHHALNGHGGISIPAWSRFFTYHLSRSLAPGLTLPVLFVAILGIVKLLRKWSVENLLFLSGVAGFYLAAELVKSKPMPQPERYALPAALFFVFAAVYFVTQLSSKTLRAASASILILWSAFSGVTTSLAIRPDTRERMNQWVEKNLSKNERIVLVGLPDYAPRVARFGFKIKAISPENGRNHTSIESLKKANYTLLLVTSLSYDRFFKEPEADQSLTERFRDYDNNLPLVHIEQGKFGSQGFHNPVLKLYRLN